VSNLLVVDVGNTNIVLGVYRGDELMNSWRLATARERTSDEYGILARQLVGEAHSAALDGAIVSSVVPPLNGAVAWMIEKYFAVDPMFVEPGVKTGIDIHVDNPQEVGADRIVNCVAAYDAFGGPTVIVDFGTATTFDLVTADGKYVGGVIAPGLNISAEALFARAARLPRVDIRRPPHVIGTNTVVNMQSGLYFGYLALVDGILARIKREVSGIRRVVATGGLADLFREESEHIDTVDSELTLKGLKLVYDRNRGPRRRKS
jgi:type III pantothenate kinase